MIKIRHVQVAGLGIASLILFLALPVSTVTAQSQNDGSVYSRFGIGELRQFYNSQTAALGGGGIALPSSRYRNMSNPASWSSQILTGIGIGFSLESTIVTDSDNNESKLASGGISSLQLGFPLKAQKLGVGIGFAPFTRSGYRVTIKDVLQSPGGQQDTVGYSIDYLGNGGLQRFEIGLGAEPVSNVSIGGAITYTFGVLEEIRETTFNDDTFRPTSVTNSTRMNGFGARFGARLHLNDLAQEGDNLMIGASADLAHGLSGVRRVFSGTSQERDTLGAAIDVDVDLPASFSAGIAYLFDNRWLLVADGTLAPWTDFSSNVNLPGYTPGSSAGLSDRRRFSGGVEVFPAGGDPFASYIQRIAYRAGIYSEEGYISPDPSETINTLGFTFGASLPTAVPGTRIDINFEVGNRGSAEDILVKDRFYKVGLNLNVGERWFIKRRFR